MSSEIANHITENEQKVLQIPRVLTIAGSDSGGGAGIQADLKTFTMLQVFGMSAITALTAQNTIGVQGVMEVPIDFVEKQLESVVSDIGVDSLKTGMLYSEEVVTLVASFIQKHSIKNVVVDPVMISSTGHKLISDSAISKVQHQLLKLSRVVTPNIPEAATILGWNLSDIASVSQMREAAYQICTKFGATCALVKGGHLAQSSQKPVESITDVLYDSATNSYHEWSHQAIHTRNDHGTGCTLAAAIAAYLAKGYSVVDAVSFAESFLFQTLYHSQNLRLGHGHGPMNHSFLLKSAQPVTPTQPDTLDAPSAPVPVSKGIGLYLQLKAACAKEWDQYINHPFVMQLAEGSLPLECFRHYIRQDFVFLTHFARANALACYKSSNLKSMKSAATSVFEIISVENELHAKFCEEFGISRAELEATPESTANMAYTRYVLEKGLSGDLLDLRVALAPCVLGYGEIGLKIESKKYNNPYRKWIEMYASDWFQSAVARTIEELDHLCEERGFNDSRLNGLIEVFQKATKLEIQFWQMGLDRSE